MESRFGGPIELVPLSGLWVIWEYRLPASRAWEFRKQDPGGRIQGILSGWYLFIGPDNRITAGERGKDAGNRVVDAQAKATEIAPSARPR